MRLSDRVYEFLFVFLLSAVMAVAVIAVLSSIISSTDTKRNEYYGKVVSDEFVEEKTGQKVCYALYVSIYDNVGAIPFIYNNRKDCEKSAEVVYNLNKGMSVSNVRCIRYLCGEFIPGRE